MRRRALRTPCFAVASLLCLVGALAQAAAPEPDPAPPVATLTFRGRTATIGAGFTWGASTLEFQGKTYPVRIDGFVLGEHRYGVDRRGGPGLRSRHSRRI